MAKLEVAFNARTVEPRTGFTTVPAGWYKVLIDDEPTMKPTKKPGGMFLHIRFSILEGQYANQKLFARLNLQNQSPEAREIAQRELSAICHATGVLDLVDTAQLQNIPILVKVKKRPGGTNEETGAEYEDSNEISGYKPITDAAALSAAGATNGATPATAGVAVPAAGAGFTPPPVASTAAPAFTPPPLATAAPVAPTAPVAPVAPTAPVAPVAPTAPAQPIYTMAAGETFTREQYNAAGWNDDMLVQQGKMTITMPAPVLPAAPPAGPAAAPQPWANGQLPPPGAPAGAPQMPQMPTAPAAPGTVANAPPPWTKPQ